MASVTDESVLFRKPFLSPLLGPSAGDRFTFAACGQKLLARVLLFGHMPGVLKLPYEQFVQCMQPCAVPVGVFGPTVSGTWLSVAVVRVWKGFLDGWDRVQSGCSFRSSQKANGISCSPVRRRRACHAVDHMLGIHREASRLPLFKRESQVPHTVSPALSCVCLVQATDSAIRCVRGHPALSTGLLATGGSLPAPSRSKGRRWPSDPYRAESASRWSSWPSVTLWSLVHRDILLYAALQKEGTSDLTVDSSDDDSDVS